MKVKLLATTIATFLVIGVLNAQEEEFKPSGQVYGKVFINYHSKITDTTLESSFEVTRAYFGYKYNFSKTLTGRVMFDVSQADVILPTNDTVKTSLQATAFLREASFIYKKGNLTVEAGMIGLLQHKAAEDFWGHRYVAKTIEDESKISQAADIGITAQYKIADFLTLDGVVRNGEGNKFNPNSDNSFRSGGGFSLIPFKGFLFRGYYDIEAKPLAQVSISHTAGYSNDKLSAGVETCYQLNNKSKHNKNLIAVSAFGSYNISTKIQVFGRYDMLTSNKLNDTLDKWNIKNDYNLIIAGVQYTPVKNFNLALDFQCKMFEKEGKKNDNIVYVHCQFVF
jgi:hypothetical protein